MSKRNFLVSLDLNKNELLNPVLHNQISHPSVAGSSGYTYFNTTDKTVYTYAPDNPNSVADWLNLGLPEGAGVTNLTYTASTRTLYSSTGTDVVLPLADATNAGLMTSAYFTALSATTGSNTGDQTSIVGITGTKAQFDTALTDGNFLYVGDVIDTNTDDYVTSAGFNTTNGVLTLTRLSGGTVTVDLDDRYSLTGHTHTYDNYVSWNLYSQNADRGAILKDEKIDFVGGTGISTVYTTANDNTITFNHSNSVVAGTATGGSGPIAYGGSFTVPTVTYDAQGHVTAKGTTSYSLPAAYSFDVQENGGTQIAITTGENLNFINGSGTTAVVVNQTNPTVTFNIKAGGVENSMLEDMGSNTIKGNPTNGTTSPTNISINTNSVLGRFTGDTTNILIDNDLSSVSSLHNELASSLAIKSYIDTSVAGQLVYQGSYNAATNTPNLETPGAGAVNKGFTYTVTVSGTFFTEAVQVGDVLISEVDDPSAEADWTIVNKNIPDIVDATITDKGIVRLATIPETNAGTLATVAVTPNGLENWTGGVTGTITTLGTIATGFWQGTNIDDSRIAFTDITTGNATTSNHGYLPKLNNVATQFLDGQGNWSTPDYFTTASARTAVSLTTTGTSGAATYSSATGIFNIPIYANDNTTYNHLAVTTTGGAFLRLAGVNPTTTDDVKFASAGATTVSFTDANTITISSTDTNTNQLTTFTLTGDTGTPQTIAHANTMTITGGDVISTVVGATDSLTINHDNVTRGANTTSTANPAHGGTFTAIDSVTSNAQGHITEANLKTVTLPAATVIPANTAYKYVGLLSGASTTHAVTHGLGEQYVTAQVFDAGTNEMVECEVVLTSSTITTFNFNVATTANQYRVVIIG